MKPIRVLLADDHTLVRAGIRSLLESREGIEVVGEARDGREALQLIETYGPDVVLMDISMPGLNGIEAIREMRASGSTARVVLLTMHEDPEYAIEALNAGALGYVVKHSASSELLSALEEALSGRTYVTPRVAGEVFSRLAGADADATPDTRGPTPRQREVLQLLVEGCSAKEIARRLGVSQRAVEHHKYNMMAQLGIKTTAGLIQYAVKQGITA